MAVFPSAESDTEKPCSAMPTAPVPTSFVPCWVHTPPEERVYTHAAPAKPLSAFPPTMAVFPSPESDTEKPWCAMPTASVPTSFVPCWVHTPTERVYTHAAPATLLSKGPPTMAVFPSAESDTEKPCSAMPTAPVPTSFVPCWVHTPPEERVYTHAAPAKPLSAFPPTMAVFPSPESDTEKPWCAMPTASVPTSFVPCWVHIPPERVYTHAAPATLLSKGPPTMAVFPSAESDTETPCSAMPTAP